MTSTLTELLNRKDQLMQDVRHLDELIRLELQQTVQPASGAPAPGKKSPVPQPREADQVPVATSGNPAYDRLSWDKKLLHHLRQSDGRGMTTAELTNVLKATHNGEWSAPAITHILHTMEREGLVRMERGKGRSRYLLLGHDLVAPSQVSAKGRER